MADQILKQATQLGSTLTSVASQQLDSVLKELRGPVGDGNVPGEDNAASLGALASNVMQIVNQIGSLLVTASQYDLIRKDTHVLLLGSANALASLTVHAGKKTTYEFLVENSGRDGCIVEWQASLDPGVNGRKGDIEVQELEIARDERRRVTIRLPSLAEGKHTLAIIAKVKGKPVARKTVSVGVLPQPARHHSGA